MVDYFGVMGVLWLEGFIVKKGDGVFEVGLRGEVDECVG